MIHFHLPTSLAGRDIIAMGFSLANLRRAAGFLRRYGVAAACAGMALAALIVLAAAGTIARRDAATTIANQAVTSAVDRARLVLARDQRALDDIARIATTGSDAAARQVLDQLSALLPEVRAAAILDADGAVQLRNGGSFDDATLSALATDAAQQVATHPTAIMLATQMSRADSDGGAIVGLARASAGIDGRPTGIALIAVDRSAFAGMDLVGGDGTPLSAEPAGEMQRVGLGDFPLSLSVPHAGDTRFRRNWIFAAIAGVGAAGVLGLIVVFGRRVRAAQLRGVRLAATERKLREQLAVVAAAADRTDEANRTKSLFFAQVTHELRTPLNAIIGFSETIRHELFGPVSNQRYLEYAGLINDAGSHLLSLINDLLDNARIEAGKMEMVPLRVSAPALARSALDLVELLAEDREITLATTGLAGCPDLNVDPRAMKQVLVNLLSNAIKYTLPGGRIELRFSERDDGGAAIEISDTGIGMSAEDLRVVFEPFGRANDNVARRQQGTGLGLALARSLVRLHGGELTLISSLDVGTTATITLPARAVCAPASAPAQPIAKNTPAKAA